MYGRVTKYHHDKDYGFILGEDKQTYFIHQSRLNGEYLNDGYLVSFHPYQNYKGKNNANDIIVIEASERIRHNGNACKKHERT